MNMLTNDHAARIDTSIMQPAQPLRLVRLADRPLPVRLYRRVRIAILKWQERCVRDEREAYLEAGAPLSEAYLRNSFAVEAELVIKQITLETT